MRNCYATDGNDRFDLRGSRRKDTVLSMATQVKTAVETQYEITCVDFSRDVLKDNSYLQRLRAGKKTGITATLEPSGYLLVVYANGARDMYSPSTILGVAMEPKGGK